MSLDDGRSIWMTDDGSRYFLVPDDSKLPPGDLAIRTILGRRCSVDTAAVASYEVTKDEADARMRARVVGALEATRQGLDELIAAVKASGKKSTEDASEEPPENEEATRVRQSLDAFAGELRGFFSGISSAVRGAVQTEVENLSSQDGGGRQDDLNRSLTKK